MRMLEENVNHLLGDNLLEEGINDQNIFKAIFLAGGPGSGKSFIAEKVYGGTGARLVNSDELLEYLFKKNDLSLVIAKEGTAEYKKQMNDRAKAKSLVKVKQKNYVNGMLPIVIDGTGKDFDNIKKKALELKKHGYDIGMVFVNTSLEVAKERNQNRDRTVPEKIVVDSWQSVQNNMGKFQKFFGRDFYIVDNSKKLEPSEMAKLNSEMAKIAHKLIKSPLRNPIGKDIISRLKAKGGKLMSDLLEESIVEIETETVLEESKTEDVKTETEVIEEDVKIELNTNKQSILEEQSNYFLDIFDDGSESVLEEAMKVSKALPRNRETEVMRKLIADEKSGDLPDQDLVDFVFKKFAIRKWENAYKRKNMISLHGKKKRDLGSDTLEVFITSDGFLHHKLTTSDNKVTHKYYQVIK